ncbi:MAG: OPT/YSL family transporter [Thermoanaerobaculia bacterium]
MGCVVAIAAWIAGDTSQDLEDRLRRGDAGGVSRWGALGVPTGGLRLPHGDRPGPRLGLGTPEIPRRRRRRWSGSAACSTALPWGLVGIGVGLAVVAELCRIPSLAFAVGVYLPVSTMVPVFLGGLLRWAATRRADGEEARERGVLFGSGLVVKEGILGVGLIAAGALGHAPQGIGPLGWRSRAVGGLGAFLLLAAAFWNSVRGSGAERS